MKYIYENIEREIWEIWEKSIAKAYLGFDQISKGVNHFLKKPSPQFFDRGPKNTFQSNL